jgi:DNA primase
MAKHDFEKINSIQITDVCKKLNITLVRGRRALCFMHEDHHPSLTIYKDTNSWFCYTCNKGGGVIDLVREYFKYDTEKACKWLEVEFNIAPKPANWKWKKVNRKKTQADKDAGKIDVDGEILEWIIANTTLTPLALKFLEDERKIKKEVYERMNIRALDNVAEMTQRLLNQFGAKRLLDNHIISVGKYGYNLTWNAPCLLFPFYDQTGKLVNIQSRYLKPVSGKYPPRFRFIKDSKTYLYNASVLNDLPECSAVLLTEGVTDALAAMSCDIKTVAVAGVSAFKDEYVDMLCDYTVFICPDNDKPGKKMLKEVQEKIGKRLGVVKELQLKDGSKDIGAYYAAHEELRFG